MYFWKGIPHKFRERLEHRLMSQSPIHDIYKSLTIDDVKKVAKTLLQHDRFDSERLSSDSEESESDSNDESSESDDSSTESDDDSDDDRKTKHKSSS